MLEFMATYPNTGAYFQRETPNGLVALDVLISGNDEQLWDRFNKIFDEIGQEEQYLLR
jgi:hypothetical protein